MTQIQLADQIKFSSPLISGFERGTRTPKREHAEALDRALSTSGELERLWIELKDTREIPDSWRSFVLLERQAVEIREYEMVVVPGVLQAPAYARYLMSGRRLGGSEEQLEQAVTARTSRLEQLDPKTTLRFVLDEAVIRRELGSPEIMRQQLDHLLSLIDNRRIRVSLVPQYAPQRPIALSPFRVMNLYDGRQVGHIEHLQGQVVVDRVTDVQACLSLFGDLQVEALSPRASLDLINEARKELS